MHYFCLPCFQWHHIRKLICGKYLQHFPSETIPSGSLRLFRPRYSLLIWAFCSKAEVGVGTTYVRWFPLFWTTLWACSTVYDESFIFRLNLLLDYISKTTLSIYYIKHQLHPVRLRQCQFVRVYFHLLSQYLRPTWDLIRGTSHISDGLCAWPSDKVRISNLRSADHYGSR